MTTMLLGGQALPKKIWWVLRGLLLMIVVVATASALVSIQSNIDIQDAAQYRLNFETGLYEATYDSGKSALFAFVVRLLSQQLAVQDPFAVISVLICSAYILLVFKMQLGWRQLAVFAFMFAMAPIFMNYTQLLRQGIASALTLYGLAAASLPIAIGLLAIAATMHQSFLLFVGVAVARRLLGSSVAGTQGPIRADRLLLSFDRVVLVLIPLGMAFFLVFGDEILAIERVQLYLNFDAASAQRIGVSLLLLWAAWLLFTTRRSHLAAFAINMLTFTALMSPFVYDFMRLQTLVMPFLLFAAVELRGTSRGRLAGAIAMLVGLLVSVSTGQLQLM